MHRASLTSLQRTLRISLALFASLVPVLLLEESCARRATSVITADGWAGARIGMSASQAGEALGATLVLDDHFSATDDCVYMHAPGATGLRFMFEGRQLVRVETRDPGYSTAEGLHAGDSEAAARRIYEGRARIEPHKYSTTGLYLIMAAPDGTHAVVVEIDEGRVVQIRGGSRPVVEYVEGCS